MNRYLNTLFSLATLSAPLAAHAASEPGASLLEVGVSAGAFMASPDHELYDSTTHEQVPLSKAAPDMGLRLAFYPLSFLGAEAEGQFVPVSTITDRNAYVMAFRAHAILQYPGRLTPFLLAGVGTLGLSSGADALGGDFDRAMHWGLGAKWWLNDRFTVRLDGRHIVSGGRGAQDGNTSHFEAMIGLGMAIWKSDDSLPLTAPIESPIRIVEAPAPPPEPTPEPVVVEEVAAIVQTPEEIAVEEVLDRVHFAWNSAVLRAADRGYLDEAVVLLNKYSTLKVEVIGHTDSTGPHKYNLELSRRRAQAVQTYLSNAGIDVERVAILGAGPDEPIDSNATADGRARNRRIEFTVRDEGSIRLRMRETLGTEVSEAGSLRR